MLSTFEIICTGRVQGVGFRPFVNKLALSMELSGTVSNNENGVIIVITGPVKKIHEFYDSLIKNPPPVSKIKNHKLREIEYQLFDGFRIIPSVTKRKLNLALTPDFGICRECLKEIDNEENRRFEYPFITCVNCGPRWAVTNTFPFERVNTTVSDFEMCHQCETEYSDSSNRRFHSQTNSCSDCGIQLSLEDNKANRILVKEKDLFKEISGHIKQGKILALKNTGGYLLCCDATNREVVNRLRRLKQRPKKPFAVLYPSIELLQRELEISEVQEESLQSVERPIVIVSSKGYKGPLALQELAPGLSQLGVMLPYSGILHLLAKEMNSPLVATSGNIHGSPVISDIQTARDLISGVADYFLHHNLEISNAQDDSVIKYSFKNHQKVLFRRARGFAPNYLNFKKQHELKIMALGAHLKSTIAFIPNDYLYLSQYLGNLDHYEVYRRFTETVNVFKKIFKEDPDQLLCDKHPSYLSTHFALELAEKLSVPKHEIQHHKAHFASVLAEHDLMHSNEEILGVVWDGTGYGEDGHIWGGEFFSYKNSYMKRVNHFQYFNWMAGDKMSREPRLSLFSLNEDQDADFLRTKFSDQELKIYEKLKKANTLKTSSVGRLFDAVASLLDLCDVNSYEGEGAILLENAIDDYELKNLKSYTPNVNENSIPTQYIWNEIYKDYYNGEDRKAIISNFLFTLATLIFNVARFYKIKKIVCSGGVFQNTTLVDMIIDLLPEDMELYLNKDLSPNDENIAYGQLFYHLHGTDQKR
ncbi:carbamoyltransferase HypF [Lutimonas zeaxanthinifaciens]|uniref:carbamoyltransferase HypF n=1 Tax=Lutimonas zeaxanthinifaciens TaxID=3060215 RepID=UPI00265CF77F|nr:carbamoyltransferase HypF [Lutimonas sp. YSD2104]WKK65619.1 carbamoyltransferase HypF [Lutimonas sp. YSD2104]